MAKSSYTLTISGTDNGFIVQAGCMSLVFEDSTKLLGEIAAWLTNPEEVEKKYLSKYRSPAYGSEVEARLAEPILRGPVNTAYPPTTPYPVGLTGAAAGNYAGLR